MRKTPLPVQTPFHPGATFFSDSRSLKRTVLIAILNNVLGQGRAQSSTRTGEKFLAGRVHSTPTEFTQPTTTSSRPLFPVWSAPHRAGIDSRQSTWRRSFHQFRERINQSSSDRHRAPHRYIFIRNSSRKPPMPNTPRLRFSFTITITILFESPIDFTNVSFRGLPFRFRSHFYLIFSHSDQSTLQPALPGAVVHAWINHIMVAGFPAGRGTPLTPAPKPGSKKRVFSFARGVPPATVPSPGSKHF